VHVVIILAPTVDSEPEMNEMRPGKMMMMVNLTILMMLMMNFRVGGEDWGSRGGAGIN
jgi:hypothetical protein